MSILTPPQVEGEEDIDRLPTAAEVLWEITAEELERRKLAHAEVNKPREKRCTECGHRITVTHDGTEAGHARGRKKPRCSQFEGYDGRQK